MVSKQNWFKNFIYKKKRKKEKKRNLDKSGSSFDPLHYKEQESCIKNYF